MNLEQVLHLMNRCLSVFILTCVASFSHGIVDGHEYPFDNPEDAERFGKLAEELRCPKCQNQNLADSNAPIAKDLRDKVYEKILAGDSDQAIVDYLVARYGDFVRYKPAFELQTAALWLTPVLIFLAALAVFIRIVRRNARAMPLSEAEQEKLTQLRNSNVNADSGDQDTKNS